jgi:hypothetical protein
MSADNALLMNAEGKKQLLLMQSITDALKTKSVSYGSNISSSVLDRLTIDLQEQNQMSYIPSDYEIGGQLRTGTSELKTKDNSSISSIFSGYQVSK